MPKVASWTINFLNLCVLILYCEAHPAEMTFPFMKIIKQSNINFNFICNESFPFIKECAEQCYFKEKTDGGCVGFLTRMGNKNCILCRPADTAEITSSNLTQINDGDEIYLMRRNEKPDIYLPLEPENITGTTIMVDGVSGTLSPSNVLAQTGKVNQGLHVNNGGEIVLSNDCLNNMATCGNALTFMMWINPSATTPEDGHITFAANSISLIYLGSGRILPSIYNDPYRYHNTLGVTVMPLGTWTHIAVVYDQRSGLWLYINGTEESFKSKDAAYSYTAGTNNPFYIGTKASQNFHRYNGAVDEIKFFYKGLSSAGELQ